jgi:hypothetical protein
VYKMKINVHTAIKPHSILIDTGAYFTMFNRTEYFSYLQPTYTHSIIRFGSSAAFRIEGEGKAAFCIADLDSIVRTVHFQHVMYVPTQSHKIICFLTLRTLRCGVNFDHPPFNIRWRIDGKDCFQHVHYFLRKYLMHISSYIFR